MITVVNPIKILTSALAANVIPVQRRDELTSVLASKPDTVAIAQTFGNPKLVRELRLKRNLLAYQSPKLDFKGDHDQVIYQGQDIGKTQILYKSPLPGELQARLAIESAIDRFLEYLQKVHQIVVLNESNRHVQVFIPAAREPAQFKEFWAKFLEEVAFSTYGKSKYQLPGLVQTFIVMLNAVTLSGRGFSTLDVPILTQDQANVLAAWYYAVVRDVGKRQKKRQREINGLTRELEKHDLSEKERNSKTKNLQDKQAMQDKEARKYTDYFLKGFGKSLKEQSVAWEELSLLEEQLSQPGITKAKQRKLQKQQEKLSSKLVFSQESVQEKLALFQQSKGNPFEFVRLDAQRNPEKFNTIAAIAKNFDKRATDQINSTRGDIFTQCVTEMYRLLELQKFAPLPEPLLTEQPTLPEMRSPGDDSKEFCYSCGVALNPKTAQWQVLRFMFERPSQRRQSSSGEGRPHICASCSALAFASPLKLTNESIILQLKPVSGDTADELKVKDYIRMLTNKELHLSAGRYVVLTSEYIRKGEKKIYVSDKLGQLQYALVKVASIFPVEVFADFNFYLIIQSSQLSILENRQLIFIKGLMDSYSQSVINYPQDKSGNKNQNKEAQINVKLGDAVRYVQKDLPFLADYTLAKTSSFSKQPQLEQSRAAYYTAIKKDIGDEHMASEKQDQLMKRAKLYEDVAALTGLTYPFVDYAELLVRKHKEEEVKKKKGKLDVEATTAITKEVAREISKLIENVNDADSFCYYASIGDETRTIIKAKLKRNRSTHFIYDRVKHLLLEKLQISELKEERDNQDTYLMLEIDDIKKAYAYFAADPVYADEKEWKDLTYHLKLSLYTRFPELIRKLKSTTED
ncbi:MAG: hypothetical protein F6K14_19240 [Symploca sp. SIO2C1]|nr:hypothetical protein [Symploca sp. SIO2C1]